MVTFSEGWAYSGEPQPAARKEGLCAKCVYGLMCETHGLPIAKSRAVEARELELRRIDKDRDLLYGAKDDVEEKMLCHKDSEH